jgi:ABC-2 type transport system permease protein
MRTIQPNFNKRMNNIKHIIKREYTTRVRKRSFIVMTILGPILMAALIIVPVVISHFSDEQKTIAIVDDSGKLKGTMESNSDVRFVDLETSIDEAKANLNSSHFDAILYIPNNGIPNRAYLFARKQVGLGVKSHIQNCMKSSLERIFIEQYCDLDIDSLKEANNKIVLDQRTINEAGVEEGSSTVTNTILGIVAGFIVYFFVFMFGSQVMRGVIEEKSNRIVEVIISSIKPVHLMFGKIIGIALVGLTQFVLWIILTFVITTAFQTLQPDLLKNKSNAKETNISNKYGNIPLTGSSLTKSDQLSNANNQEVMDEITESLKTINFGVMISMFLFYFLGGYLLYGALFAAIGAAVDNEADTQQFMLPITIPLIFALVMAQFVTNNPSGPISFWLSIIPFTSPIIMMIRLPFGVPIPEVILSMTLLVFGFIFTTWLAAKIYRTGILMYGKKVSYRELWKWLKY